MNKLALVRTTIRALEAMKPVDRKAVLIALAVHFNIDLPVRTSTLVETKEKKG